MPAARRVDPLPEIAQRAGEPVSRRLRRRTTAGGRRRPRAAVAPPRTAAGAGPQAHPSHRRRHRGRASTSSAFTATSRSRPGCKPSVSASARRSGSRGRISQQNWIEQAQILAKGGETHFSRREGARRGGQCRADARRGRAAAGGCPATAVTPRAFDGRCGGRCCRGRVGTVAARVPACAAIRRGAERRPMWPSARRSRRTAARQPPPSPAPAPQPAAGRIRAAGRARGARQPAAHRRHRRPSSRCWPGRASALLPDRALGAGRCGALRQADRRPIGCDGPHRARELDRAGADPEPRRRHRLFARVRPARPCAAPAAAPHQARATPSARTRRRPRPRAASARRTDLGSLRSVRSEAYQSPEAGPRGRPARRRAEQGAALGPPNDLKRIRGIGVLIEKKLNSMGVTAYEQIANWTGRGHRPHQPVARLQGPHRARELGGAGAHPGVRRRHGVLPPGRPGRGGDQPLPPESVRKSGVSAP